MLLDVSPGQHQIEITFRTTPWRTLALILSFGSGIVLLGMSLAGLFQKGMKSQPDGFASAHVE
jgi:hypothetical protein